MPLHDRAATSGGKNVNFFFVGGGGCGVDDRLDCRSLLSSFTSNSIQIQTKLGDKDPPNLFIYIYIYILIFSSSKMRCLTTIGRVCVYVAVL